MNWRERILREFTPALAAVTRLTVVSDPDSLLLEQGVLDELRHTGFELIPFEDPVAFRFQYERQFRDLWDRGESTNLVVVLRTAEAGVESLPYDLLMEAKRDNRVLGFNIAQLFPELVPSVVRDLDRQWFDPLWKALRATPQPQLGDNRTREFILRAVFKVVPEHIETEAQLLHQLLKRHYAGIAFSRAVDQYFIQKLRGSARWKQWPLDQIIPDRDAFFAFLQERWPRFLRARASADDGPNVAASPEVGYNLKVPGPLDLPFDHDDVRIYIDNLFLEGMLAPVPDAPDLAGDAWWRVGVQQATPESEESRYERLTTILERDLPDSSVTAQSWLTWTPRFAEWLAIRWEVHPRLSAEQRQRAEAFHDRVEASFYEWLELHYAGLASLPYLPAPRMVHHIPLWMRHKLGKGKKTALVVVDGLAWDQWVLVRRHLDLEPGHQHQVAESAAFAWLPTLTSISRQSIFAGKMPLFFESSINTLHKEPAHWKGIWVEKGLLGPAVGFVSQGKRAWPEFMDAIRAEAEHPHRRALGIVVYKVDKTMHDLEFGHGSNGMHAMIKHWAEQGELSSLLNLLLNNDFDIVLTADHGNIGTQGIGKPNVGKAAESRGQRVHIYSDDRLRESLHKKVPGSHVWAGPGIPASMKALFPPGRTGFVKEGPVIIAHGGPSVEEVIVPLISIKRVS